VSSGETILIKYTSFNSSFQYEQFDVLFSKSIFESRRVFLVRIRVKSRGQNSLAKYKSLNSCFQYEQSDVHTQNPFLGNLGFFGSLRGQNVKIFGSNDT